MTHDVIPGAGPGYSGIRSGSFFIARKGENSKIAIVATNVSPPSWASNSPAGQPPPFR